MEEIKATFVFTNNLSSLRCSFAGLFLITISATFYATDTLRVMSILFIPVLLYGAEYLSINFNKEKYGYFITLFFSSNSLFIYCIWASKNF